MKSYMPEVQPSSVFFMSQELVSEINSRSYPSKTTNLRPDNLGSYYSDI